MFPSAFSFGKWLKMRYFLAAVSGDECQRAGLGSAGTEPSAGILVLLFSPALSEPEMERDMKTLTLAAMTGVAALLAACNQSPAEQRADQTEEMGEAQADAIVEQGEQRADALENRADAVDNQLIGEPPAAEALENRADTVRDAAEQRAERMEEGAEQAADVQRRQN